MSDAEQPTLAERQLAKARRDPRLVHGPAATVADWWAAVEAAERTRNISIIATHELAKTHLKRTSELDGIHYWERAELARVEVENDFPELNAWTLVSLVSTLDALVEAMVPQAQRMAIDLTSKSMIERIFEAEPKLLESIEPEQVERAEGILAGALLDKLGALDRVAGLGAKRWESRLRGAGLSASKDREIPADLDMTLTELVAIRHSVVHRASRVDERALEDAPTLAWREGELIRIGGRQYRLYSAAILTYGEEVVWRLLRGVGVEPPDLSNWSNNHTIGS